MISFIDFPRSERETTLESSLQESGNGKRNNKLKAVFSRFKSNLPAFYFYYQSSFIIPIRVVMEFPKIE